MKIHTYKEIESFIRMFADKKANLVIIKSTAGAGKTSLVNAYLKGADYYFINSHVTPLQFYKDIYTNRNKPIYIDDVDNLLQSKISIAILKQLCSTDEVKTIQYHSTSYAIADVPMSFTTTSNVLILCNEFGDSNENLKALIDRAMFVNFVPTKEEMIKRMVLVTNSYPKLELPDRLMVLEFIKQNYDYGKDISLRTLVKAFQLFDACRDKWKEYTLETMKVDSKLKEVIELISKFDKDKDRVSHFSGSRASYYRLKKEMQSHKSQDSIKVSVVSKNKIEVEK